MAYLSEAAVEQVVLDQLATLGYSIATDADIGPDGKAPEREAYADVVLIKRLTAAIDRLNPAIPAEARADAVRKVLATEKPSLVEENRRLREKIEELRIVERAKCVLIEHLQFTEEQAHRYIEKQAMDRRSTRRTIAESILNTYEA